VVDQLFGRPVVSLASCALNQSCGWPILCFPSRGLKLLFPYPVAGWCRYALELLRFREIRQDAILRDLKTRWERQAKAFANLVRQPDRVQKLADIITRLV